MRLSILPSIRVLPGSYHLKYRPLFWAAFVFKTGESIPARLINHPPTSLFLWQSGKTGAWSKQCLQTPKKCVPLRLKQELCYIKFKLDIELNEVVNLTVNTGLTPESVPLKTTSRFFERLLFLQQLPLRLQLLLYNRLYAASGSVTFVKKPIVQILLFAEQSFLLPEKMQQTMY